MELVAVTKSLLGKKLYTGLNFVFPEGKVSLLGGKNGIGKTTLLRLATGVLRPESGKVLWRGVDSFRRLHEIGFSPADDGGFYPTLTVRENLEFFAALYGISASDLTGRLEKLSPFSIDYMNLPIERCSQGMRQKVKLARALLHDPALLLLDEPFNALDVDSRDQFESWLKHKCRGRTVILVQHGYSGPFPTFTLEKGEIRPC